MITLSILLAAMTSSPSVGALYPHGVLSGAPEHSFCSTRYRFTTDDPIDRVAAFYRSEADAAQIPVLDDSQAKFVDYRTVVFVQEPKFLSVVISRKSGQTQAIVSYHLDRQDKC